jgi:hypothetical protein
VTIAPLSWCSLVLTECCACGEISKVEVRAREGVVGELDWAP